MKSLTEQFEEIIKQTENKFLDGDITSYDKLTKKLIKAVKARDEEVLKEEEEPINFEHPYYIDEVRKIETRNELIEEIKEAMEKSL